MNCLNNIMQKIKNVFLELIWYVLFVLLLGFGTVMCVKVLKYAETHRDITKVLNKCELNMKRFGFKIPLDTSKPARERLNECIEIVGAYGENINKYKMKKVLTYE